MITESDPQLLTIPPWVVEKHAFENVPEDQKGPGKFVRKATPGGWKEDLAPEQVEVIEGVAGFLIRKYYSG